MVLPSQFFQNRKKQTKINFKFKVVLKIVHRLKRLWVKCLKQDHLKEIVLSN